MWYLVPGTVTTWYCVTVLVLLVSTRVAYGGVGYVYIHNEPAHIFSKNHNHKKIKSSKSTMEEANEVEFVSVRNRGDRGGISLGLCPF
jgi:hypothetical protein